MSPTREPPALWLATVLLLALAARLLVLNYHLKP